MLASKACTICSIQTIETPLAFVSIALAPAAAECRRDNQIFENAHAAEWLRNLKRAANAERAALRRRHCGDVAPRIDDATGIRRDRAADNAEQCRLAGAVRPDNAERFAGCQPQIQALGNDDCTEAFGDLFKREKRCGHLKIYSSPRCAGEDAFAIADQIA